MVDFLNVCNATQLHKDSPPMHKGCTTDAQWVHRGCTMEAPRMHVGRTTDAVWMQYGSTTNSFTCTTDAPGKPQMLFEHTMGAPGMPHACFTDAPRIHFRCTMNALRLSTDVSRAPTDSIHHGYTMYSVRMHCLF